MAIKIALAGNPNCGKTTMFNALTGANQYVGNWPGVTVEKKEGKLKSSKSGEEIIITDLPGVYSLSPYTLEEVVSRDYLVHEKPQAIINLVDATNIERNLYLTTQILEIGIPVVIALNMADLLAKSGDKIDVKKLSEIFGCEVVETSALKGTGLKEVVEKAIEAAKKNEWKNPAGIFSGSVENAIEKVEEAVGDAVDADQKRWFAIKLLEKDSKVIEQLHLPASAMAAVNTEVTRLEKETDDDTESIITDERYTYIGSVIDKAVKKSGKKLSTSDKIDKIVTNRILGIPIFAAVMWFVYYICVSTLGTMGTDWANDTFGGGIQEWAGAALAAAGASDFIQSLVVDGILGGLFAVFGFLPQMALLFLMLSILEDCGYMVRIAFVMDRVFRHFGLSGKSFIPLLIASGCGIPGIMASKTIENDNDRRLTIMTATFIPCGAKLPVIALLGGIMVGWTSGDYSDAGNTAFLMYALGIVCVLVAAIMLKKTKPFSGEAAPFVMELPAYHIPSAKTVLMHTWERLWGFIKKAGTILFLACVIMWILSTFGFENGSFGMVEDTENCLMAILGSALAWIFTPLGWGKWQCVAAAISGFSAKEGIVSTMGVLANVSEDLSEETDVVAAAIRDWFPTMAAAFSFLVFNLLNSPCLAAISTMAQQMQSRKWFWFAIIFQNVFAYCVALMFYQFGLLMEGGSFGIGTAAAVVVLLGFLYMLFRPDPYKNQKKASRRSVAA
ncbi:MAG: ferrous iron transport protein B [Candidatus Copromonas sp.]|jgi:ferrous iron transport protein B|nr:MULTISPECIES: ferrous iron transport protein B [unclassified Clostridium]MBT9790987.1 ferrous iron transport protein B [Clostridium sp. MCC344]MDR3780476.1 ferrous iron transport protein B [Candidatus Copromonas sp.]